MFKVTIINIKELGKACLKIIVILTVVLVLASITKKLIENKPKNNQKMIIDYSFIDCFEICMPVMKEKVEYKQNNYILSQILDFELPNHRYEKIELEIDSIDEEKNKQPDQTEHEIKEITLEEKYTNTYKNVNIKNETEFNLTEEMLIPDISFQNPKNILIFHTHTCESYTPSESFQYEMTGTYRTTDLNYSVVRVGKELSIFLQNKGFNVKHETAYHDYPKYSGSYDRSYVTVKKDLEELKDTEIIFDIHRDAIGNDSYCPIVKIDNEYAAQMMFVIGTNGGGLEHPNWIQNLKFAIKIQQIANEKYPGLFRPIILRNSRYNQNLAKGAVIIEVGATGNTLEQCINSMKYLTEVLDEAF